MRGLFYKDLVCAGVIRYLLVVLAVLLLPVIVLPFLLERETVGVVIFMYLGTCILTLYANTVLYIQSIVETDNSVCVEVYMRSLPVSRSQYVAAKYILAFGIYLVLMAVSMLAFLLGMPLFRESGLPGIGKVTGCLPSVTGAFLVLVAVQLPFYIRFGAAAGERIRVTVLVVLFFAGLVWLMFGDLTILHRLHPDALGDWLEAGADRSEWYMVVIPIVSLVVYGLSGLLSVWLYPHKEMGE